MRALNLFLAVFFAVPICDGAVAAVAKNPSRSQNSVARTTQNISARNTDTTKSRTQSNTTVSSRTATNKNIISRPTSTISRTATTRATTPRTAINKSTISRTATVPQSRTTRGGISRAATMTRDTIMTRDFGKCKTVFFDCMDEFCANKDAQLKRCACSTRANEFTATQKSLDNAEDKLLDFSQRLLHVNMDPDDAAVINRASEGEAAYYATADKTASKKTLDEIAKKLNANFEQSGNNMSALSWSLDIDSAFDSIDPLSGASTTAKSGISLRNAALPICREMATEVCDATDITLVENSYNMAIEQDCNTVKKSFETQVQATRTKILESGALLDMTRLNKYQENNADDILTCKSKMLDMLTNTNVCGENLTKCLDISGRYINPTTGAAFLSPELVNISTLIVRPTSTDSWAKIPKNASFVSYLNAKKKYIEPATKNCESIADDVWDSFIDDALAKIKLAQNAKLEEVRQSCTTLLTECLDNANENLSEFDSRALSTFGVISDKTVNALCKNVRTSCNAIMQYNADDAIQIADADINAWSDGVRDISATETYNRILNTCREIGRDCIINSCKSITGNFGLCESINGSVNRHSILTRAACWDDVLNCVSGASDETINDIHALLNGQSTTDLYNNMYPETPDYDICSDQSSINHPCYDNLDSVACYKCRLAEQIWGNCQHKPDNLDDNAILIPTDPTTTTLLSWFAKNTHTDTNNNSCATSICPAGSLDYTVGTSIMCVAPDKIVKCATRNILCTTIVTTPTNTTNCCETNVVDKWSNCCMNGGVTSSGITQYLDDLFDSIPNARITQDAKICTPNNNTTQMTLVAKYGANNNKTYIFCTDSVTGGTIGDNDASINCGGDYIIVSCNGTTCTYNKPTPTNNGFDYDYSMNYFINANGATVSGTDNGHDSITVNTLACGNDNHNCAEDYCPENNPQTCTRTANGWDCNTTNTNGHWMVEF